MLVEVEGNGSDTPQLPAPEAQGLQVSLQATPAYKPTENTTVGWAWHRCHHHRSCGTLASFQGAFQGRLPRKVLIVGH